MIERYKNEIKNDELNEINNYKNVEYDLLKTLEDIINNLVEENILNLDFESININQEDYKLSKEILEIRNYIFTNKNKLKEIIYNKFNNFNIEDIKLHKYNHNTSWKLENINTKGLLINGNFNKVINNTHYNLILQLEENNNNIIYYNKNWLNNIYDNWFNDIYSNLYSNNLDISKLIPNTIINKNINFYDIPTEYLEELNNNVENDFKYK
jgi:hypothetical protein